MNHELAQEWFDVLKTTVDPMHQDQLQATTSHTVEPSSRREPGAHEHVHLSPDEDAAQSTRELIVDLGPVSNLAAEVGNALAHRRAAHLRPTFERTPVDAASNRVYGACWTLLREATTPRQSPSAVDIDVPLPDRLDGLAASVWNSPDAKGFGPLLDWLSDRISGKKTGALLRSHAIIVGYRDLARALFLTPDAAEKFSASYSGLHTEVNREYLQTVFALFSLLGDLVLGAHDAIIHGIGVSTEEAREELPASFTKKVPEPEATAKPSREHEPPTDYLIVQYDLAAVGGKQDSALTNLIANAPLIRPKKSRRKKKKR